MFTFVPPLQAPEPKRWGFSPRRLLPEPERNRRVSKSAPRPTDAFGLALEEWLAEQKVRYTFDGD